jgi:DNA-directed RNA polymerase subunit M/transcription elongation factor TFIIS
MSTTDTTRTDRLKELLQEQLRSFTCSVCHHDEFAFLDAAEPGLVPNLMLYQGNDLHPKKRTPLLTIACLNCGHLEQFAREPLERRLSQSED